MHEGVSEAENIIRPNPSEFENYLSVTYLKSEKKNRLSNSNWKEEHTNKLTAKVE